MMTDGLQTANIHDLKISDRPEDANLYDDHQVSVDSFRATCLAPGGFRLASLESFRTHDLQRYLQDTGTCLRKTVKAAGFYDLGIVRNDMISWWAQQAENQPVAEKPWSGDTAIFVATHPEEVTFDKTLSIYMLQKIDSSDIALTELVYIKASNMIMVYQSIVATMPFGSSLEVKVIAFSEQPTDESVSSTLNPALMCVAFLASRTAGRS